MNCNGNCLGALQTLYGDTDYSLHDGIVIQVQSMAPEPKSLHIFVLELVTIASIVSDESRLSIDI